MQVTPVVANRVLLLEGTRRVDTRSTSG
ncbi:hypothetical protein CUMW_033850 [Citrus unshiu]|nr:hypothetical protein CUMW_033850 [Citrus unshiu]